MLGLYLGRPNTNEVLVGLTLHLPRAGATWSLRQGSGKPFKVSLIKGHSLSKKIRSLTLESSHMVLSLPGFRIQPFIESQRSAYHFFSSWPQLRNIIAFCCWLEDTAVFNATAFGIRF
ncbi:hypothetical protein J5N97_003423 [Dioscorea zingiberensis]|uniref:Uncharacterized protein n=1 Tax=Dioscorea zingiberensis TaxID=325984 RepID=A0A9D5HR85_9LILI|nr:hypothetical protein J5N97_003423 [Dioscorea zingiberensis]